MLLVPVPKYREVHKKKEEICHAFFHIYILKSRRDRYRKQIIQARPFKRKPIPMIHLPHELSAVRPRGGSGLLPRRDRTRRQKIPFYNRDPSNFIIPSARKKYTKNIKRIYSFFYYK